MLMHSKMYYREIFALQNLEKPNSMLRFQDQT